MHVFLSAFCLLLGPCQFQSVTMGYFLPRFFLEDVVRTTGTGKVIQFRVHLQHSDNLSLGNVFSPLQTSTVAAHHRSPARKQKTLRRQCPWELPVHIGIPGLSFY